MLDDERVALGLIVVLLPCLISVWALPLLGLPACLIGFVATVLIRDTRATRTP